MNSPEDARLQWLGLSIGNSRYHWAAFGEQQLLFNWETPHLEGLENPLFAEGLNWLQQQAPQFVKLTQLPEVWLVSVVPAQTQYWRTYPRLKLIERSDIPLPQAYPTLGIDRMLAAWGAGRLWGWPLLVIDAGTGLTLTGVNAKGQFVGGAILPGLGLQRRSLAEGTAALPTIAFPEGHQLPPRWARNTESAIASGIIYSLLSGIDDFVQDWQQSQPGSQIVVTGGDGALLMTYFQHWHTQRQPHSKSLDTWKCEPLLNLLAIQQLRLWLRTQA